MKLLAATRSKGKQPELRHMMEAAGHEVIFPEEAGIWEDPAEEMLEHESSFEGNARKKAEYFARLSGLPTFADDSGLEGFSLGGPPGVRSKRFAGPSGSGDAVDSANNAELLRRLAGAPEAKRAARYRCVIALIRKPGGVPEIFEGQTAGRIIDEARGSNGFGYDPYFLSAELGKTFGEASAEEKDAISHRGRALAQLLGAIGDEKRGSGL